MYSYIYLSLSFSSCPTVFVSSSGNLILSLSPAQSISLLPLRMSVPKTDTNLERETLSCDKPTSANHSKPAEMLRQATPPLRRRAAVVCDLEGGLLRSSSCFPYFMVVALENGSLLRALLLLLLHPFLSLFGEETRIRAMTLISFCGISVSSFRLGIAVLPKHLLENVGREGFQLLMKGKKKVCVSRMPKVMVEEFLRKYLRAEVVVAREMKVVLGFYTGFMEEKVAEEEVLVEKELSGGDGEEDGALGVSAESMGSLHPLFSRCKERISLTQAHKSSWQQLSREEHPEPLIFHDGRIAFNPSPLSTIAMLLWLPFGSLLALLRLLFFLLLPYPLSTSALALSGMKNRLVSSPFTPPSAQNPLPGRLFVCNHRTLIDPLSISCAISSPVTSVVYGVSLISQVLSPIKTVMLSRTRDRDKAMIERELEQGDVVICPEGTTCREPYLLRFSPLFAELAEEVRPVAIETKASMFYGTTAGGTKFLDPFFVLLNPYTLYTVEFLASVKAGERKSSCETANRTQEAIAAALGFRCTKFTRKDKYLALVGNDGVAHRST